MIASPRDTRRPLALLAASLLLAAAGCRAPGALPRESALLPLAHRPVLVPDVADQTAAQVAAAALVSDREEARLALDRLEDIDTVLSAWGEPTTGLAPVARDLVNTTVDEPRLYRRRTDELLDDDAAGLDDATRSRLELEVEDDPLRLARARMFDAYMIEFGRAFNAIAEPIGQSITNTSMAPYRLGRALLAYLAELYASDPLLLQERQALVHWKTYLARNPESEEAPEVREWVEDAEVDWRRTKHKHAVRNAEVALDRDQARLALVYADRALDYAPEDETASDLRDDAADRLLRQRADRARSLGAPASPAAGAPEAERALARALLLPDGDVTAAARQLRAADPDGGLADEAAFARAIALGEAGDEDGMWELLDDVAAREDVNMARHAAALVRNPDENAYDAFLAARRRNGLDNALWVFVGPFYRGFPERGLPEPLSWALDMPGLAESVMGSPMRLIQLPWTRSLPSARIALHHGYRYLERYPDGEHADEVAAWIESFEKKRGNWIGAYAAAERRPDVSIETLDEYREKAAQQSLDAANRADRRDVRLSMLRGVVQRYPDTPAGRAAGQAIRSEVMAATPHRIRISRGFLSENPDVAGPGGVGLRPALLDGDASNGELHPDGMALLGGNDVAFYYLGESGDDEDPPLIAYETIEPERLARLVSALEEATFENSLEDSDDPVQPNAPRDVFFERARLGLDTETDSRPTAASEHVYLGMRERYGVVRGRESILPFDIVIKGSLTDLSFGAFPRIRKPRTTPDAFLYR